MKKRQQLTELTQCDLSSLRGAAVAVIVSLIRLKGAICLCTDGCCYSGKKEAEEK